MTSNYDWIKVWFWHQIRVKVRGGGGWGCNFVLWKIVDTQPAFFQDVFPYHVCVCTHHTPLKKLYIPFQQSYSLIAKKTKNLLIRMKILNLLRRPCNNAILSYVTRSFITQTTDIFNILKHTETKYFNIKTAKDYLMILK